MAEHYHTHDSRPARLVAPDGATDTHFHLFGDPNRYPIVGTRDYTPPLITPAQTRQLFDRLGIQRAVVIQPSVYGTDNRAQLEGASQLGIPTRAVIVTPYETSDTALMKYHEQGARGLRFTLAHPGGLPAADLERWAQRLHEIGWHMQFLARAEQLLELAPRIDKLACPAVIDHIGMIQPGAGLQQPAFQAVLGMLQQGHWVKLSGPYRLSQQPPPYPELKPFVEELLATRPDRLIWGSDWPHVFTKGPAPNTTDMFDLLADWVPDEHVRKRILVDNPARLYGF